ncbi:phosphomannomutase [Dasania sp. GY-MA-18]|uniref:phosphomannomutase n=1 Tax=Dasania phycosphaerae TaxID=2950436 RepID=A0A9J6RRH3_9GAMM|nr:MULTISPECIES: phosphomannomutase [Dasania]MCR8924096.1 phosphomannomutase [Dasania sp. GY-MA-18]MCZ0866669.1 phosphomannomutase [Dasania phycosphaerae]MCZ0870254.1 phosphomannomutase [Dasania phycosphaerae]
MSQSLSCFKAYDVRGRIPDQLNPEIAYRIGRAYAEVIKPQRVAVGYDIRLTSQELKAALAQGLLDSGVDVYDIGQCGTEEIYFAAFAGEVDGHKMDGGIVVTASHNPKDYNGMKFVREGAKPISGDTGLFDIQRLAEQGSFSDATQKGQLHSLDTADAYIAHLLSYVDVAQLKPMKIVVNAGNGGAGDVIDRIESHLPFEFIKVHHQADGNFPNGVPNPLLVENRQPTIDAVQAHKADMGIAWDGDFDRCFFFDENGEFLEGYYVVGLLAEAFLAKSGAANIVHDPRLTWNTIALVEAAGGTAVQSKTGHAFIKERMRKENAVYGGEMSAHHYFRDFAYCDSGMIPWLLVAQLIQQKGLSLSQLVAERVAAYPCSGEINRKVDDAAAVLQKVEQTYCGDALDVDRTDGLSVSFTDWRFSLRMSNTEPVIRLNVESRGDVALMQRKTEELLNLIA